MHASCIGSVSAQLKVRGAPCTSGRCALASLAAETQLTTTLLPLATCQKERRLSLFTDDQGRGHHVVYNWDTNTMICTKRKSWAACWECIATLPSSEAVASCPPWRPSPGQQCLLAGLPDAGRTASR